MPVVINCIGAGMSGMTAARGQIRQNKNTYWRDHM
jgi:hypothetical protein